MNDYVLTIPYGVLLVLGGIMGYAKKRSTASLAGGLTTGVLLLLAGYLSLNAYHNHIVAALLTWIMGNRYLQTRKIMPAGVVAGISLVMTIFYIYKIASGGNNISHETELIKKITDPGFVKIDG